MTKFLAFALFNLALSAPAPAGAGDTTVIDLREALIAALAGEFDSLPQLSAEQFAGTPKDLQHGHVYRSYTVVEAPALGETVLVGTVRYGGRDGSFDKSEFQVWTVAADRDGAVMTPRRFKTPEAFVDIGRNAAALSKMTPGDLLPPAGAAGCAINWRYDDGLFLGRTDKDRCVAMSSTLKKELSWAWSYVLDRSGIWLSYAGRDETGEIVNGRGDQLPWRLQRTE